MSDDVKTIKLNPDEAYPLESLAAVLGKSVRTIQRLRKNRRSGFPRPFKMGRTPCWTGRSVLAWIVRKEEEANVFMGASSGQETTQAAGARRLHLAKVG